MLGIYMIVGAFSGVVSGLFGVGGGIIMVPALEAIFTTFTTIPPAHVMHMAIGTSLATMIFTTLAGLYVHIQHGAVQWKAFKQIMPPLLLGVVLGAIITHFLPSHSLKMIFGLFLGIISCRILIGQSNQSSRKPFSQRIIKWVSAVIGIFTSILGAGGGTMIIPFLMRLRLNMHEALGTSLLCGTFVSLVATLCFMLTGFITPEKIAWSTGYIYWPAFLGIVFASVIFAPLGAALAHKLSTPWLKRLFAVFLLLISFDMLFFSR